MCDSDSVHFNSIPHTLKLTACETHSTNWTPIVSTKTVNQIYCTSSIILAGRYGMRAYGCAFLDEY